MKGRLVNAKFISLKILLDSVECFSIIQGKHMDKLKMKNTKQVSRIPQVGEFNNNYTRKIENLLSYLYSTKL